MTRKATNPRQTAGPPQVGHGAAAPRPFDPAARMNEARQKRESSLKRRKEQDQKQAFFAAAGSLFCLAAIAAFSFSVFSDGSADTDAEASSSVAAASGHAPPPVPQPPPTADSAVNQTAPDLPQNPTTKLPKEEQVPKPRRQSSPSETHPGVASSASTPATPPQSSGNPFVELLDEVDLPPRSTGGALQAQPNTEVSFGKLQSEAKPDWVVTVSHIARGFRVKAGQQGKPHWQIFAAAGGDTAGESRGEGTSQPRSILGAGGQATDLPVATVFADKGNLWLRWNADYGSKYAERLRNSILMISDGRHKHATRLRQLVKQQAIAVNLDQETTRIPVEASTLPPEEMLEMEIGQLHGFGGSWTIDPPARSVPVGESARIKYAAQKIELELELRSGDGTAEIVMTPVYYSGDRKQPFTGPEVKESLRRIEGVVADKQARRAELQNRIARIPGEIAGLQQYLNGASAAAAALRIRKLQSAMKSARRGVEVIDRSIPRMEEAAKELLALAEVGRQVHDKTSIDVRVVARSPAGSLDLFVASAGQPSSVSTHNFGGRGDSTAESRIVGADQGSRFEDRHLDQAPLIGFEVTFGDAVDSSGQTSSGIITSLQPVYRTDQGAEAFGKVYGRYTRQLTSIRAKEGYAICDVRTRASISDRF